MKTDYAFMKTGLSGGGGGNQASFEDFFNRILGVITVMLQKAVETAGVFAEHGMYHREITAEDIRRAMKVQAQTFFKSEGDELENRVASAVQDIAHEEEAVVVVKKIKLRPIRRRGKGKKLPRRPFAEDDVAVDVAVAVAVAEDVPDMFHASFQLDLPYNACECPTCTNIRALVEGWDAWDPEDEVEQFLKKHIDSMI